MAHSLFSVHGIEIEYALMRRRDGRVAPLTADLLTALGGSPDSHPVFGAVEIDNELAAHVLEIKAREPAPRLLPLLKDFNAAVHGVNLALVPLGATLLPGGMHPFMDPAQESRLWDYEDNPIYTAYDRVFSCRGHGWFNIQSTHLNLPFQGDPEFSQLHNGISLLLPLLPALAAASPIWDGRPGAWLDGRLYHYAQNQKKLPEIAGPLVPEPMGSESEYRERILKPMYRAIAPFDPEEILQDEWLNSRAAIARFDRGAIEIRCLDTQEFPLVDLALCHFTTCVLKLLAATNRDLYAAHKAVPPGLLRSLFLETAEKGRGAHLPSQYPVHLFGVLQFRGSVGGFLEKVVPAAYRLSEAAEEAVFRPVVEDALRNGNFAERILNQWEKDPDPRRLCETLAMRLDDATRI
jgi:carboxylate-amine ligase